MSTTHSPSRAAKPAGSNRYRFVQVTPVSAALRLGLVAALATLLLTACGDWNRGQGVEVLDARVVRVVETGDRNLAATGMRQPFQRLELQLDSGLYRGEIVTVEWGGRRALDPNGFVRPGDRVLVSESREGGTRDRKSTRLNSSH